MGSEFIITTIATLSVPAVMLLIFFSTRKDKKIKSLEDTVANTHNQMGKIIVNNYYGNLSEELKNIVRGVQESTSGNPTVTPPPPPAPDSDGNDSKDE